MKDDKGKLKKMKPLAPEEEQYVNGMDATFDDPNFVEDFKERVEQQKEAEDKEKPQ